MKFEIDTSKLTETQINNMVDNMYGMALGLTVELTRGLQLDDKQQQAIIETFKNELKGIKDNKKLLVQTMLTRVATTENMLIAEVTTDQIGETLRLVLRTTNNPIKQSIKTAFDSFKQRFTKTT